MTEDVLPSLVSALLMGLLRLFFCALLCGDVGFDDGGE